MNLPLYKRIHREFYVCGNIKFYDAQEMAVIWDGVIFNQEKLGFSATTPCEDVLVTLFINYGLELTLRKLDGDFAFIVVEFRTFKEQPVLVTVARDILGARPLFCTEGCLSSRPCTGNPANDRIFPAGNYKILSNDLKMHSEWVIHQDYTDYFIPPLPFTVNPLHDNGEVKVKMRQIMCHAIRKRQAALEASGCTIYLFKHEKGMNSLFWLLEACCTGALIVSVEFITDKTNAVFFSCVSDPYVESELEIFYPALDRDYYQYLHMMENFIESPKDALHYQIQNRPASSFPPSQRT